MKPLLAILTLALLPGCVSIPVPPFGERIGEYGHLKLSVNIQYLPATNQTTDAGLDHAQRQFQASLKTLKDK